MKVKTFKKGGSSSTSSVTKINGSSSDHSENGHLWSIHWKQDVILPCNQGKLTTPPSYKQTQGRPATPPLPCLPPLPENASGLTVRETDAGQWLPPQPVHQHQRRWSWKWPMHVAHWSNSGNCHQRWSWPSKVLFQKECVASYSDSLLSHFKKESIS